MFIAKVFYPETAQELLETAILAEGEKAQTLHIHPSQYEALLARDYLVGLRCLGYQIPAKPELLHKLVTRLATELLHQTDLARFSPYRQALQEQLPLLKGSQAAAILEPLLISAATDSSPLVRQRAVQSLVQLGETPARIIPILLKALTDTDNRLPHAAARGLAKLGQATPEIIEALLAAFIADAGSIGNVGAAGLIPLSRDYPEVLPALLQLANHPQAAVRIAVATSLGNLGETSEEVFMAFLTALTDQEEACVRATAATSLYRLGKFTPEIVSALLKALEDQDWTVRERAVLSLGWVAPATSEITEAVRQVLADDESDIARYMAAMSLGQLAQATPEVVDTLIKALNDEHPQVCYGSARSLGQLGVPSPAVLTALLKTIREPRSGHYFDIAELHYSAAESLIKLGHTTPEIVYTLLKSLATHNSDWRPSHTSAAELLGQPGVMNPEVSSTLQAALDDDEVKIRHQAALILVQLNQTPAEVFPILSNALQQDPSRFVRRDAARFLGQISVGNEQIIELLWQSLRDEHQDVREVCPEAFIQLARRFPEQREMIIAKLLQAIADPVLDQEPQYGFGIGQDYAYKALWGGDCR